MSKLITSNFKLLLMLMYLSKYDYPLFKQLAHDKLYKWQWRVLDRWFDDGDNR